jgi:mono/diheme cytochrome c family protein
MDIDVGGCVTSVWLRRWQRTISILVTLAVFGGSALANAEERDRGAKGSDLDSVVRDASAIQAGKERFSERCAFCHGGAGRGAKGPCLTCGRFRHGGSDATLYANIAGGIPGTQMGAFGTTLSQEEIANIIAYLRAETERRKAAGELDD